MASLASLPVEILHGICHRLALLSTESLRNLCLANKDLNRICSPCLVYRWSAGQDCVEPPLEQLLLHLFRHPELRKEVKSLGIGYTMPPGGTTYLFSSPSPVDLDRETLSELAEAAASDIKMKPEYLEELCSDIKLGCTDALNVLLLAWCTDVADLSIALPPLYAIESLDSHVLTFAREAILRLLPDETPADNLPFGEVRHFELQYYDHHHLYFKAVTPFFHLPKIKSVVAFGLCDYEIEWMMWCSYGGRYDLEIPDASSSLEELVLTNAMFAQDALYTLLRGVRNLRKLKLQTFVCSKDYPTDREEIADVLTICQDSLEELYLDTEPREHLLDPDSRRIDFGILANEMLEEKDVFKDFINLRRLSCPMTDFVSVNCDDGQNIVPGKLPKSIEFLKPRCYDMAENWVSNDSSVGPYIEAFIKILEEAGPGHRLCNLTVLDLSETFKDDLETVGINRMKYLADARGVRLLLKED
ncbi:hypothetical protein FVEN_g713 [Fusarium venenatum]|uniref:F-box domain-containing protein n=1 Tax=Fusarium venenatum TaxID=56646 RepID=A0A2L2TXE8_9HYPO|nr:uncharacterized protein FVRRES_10884 [Fusarium venenatum]KAG8361451.1 hypothetical protein FVEN_g713 [Fusarium venenatum]KAH6967458.1 hypothetical protein EDB82DRAFT_531139 [Fusarium venenatum]CEI70807.1 unnamed protein product [Fusarium venenatum]